LDHEFTEVGEERTVEIPEGRKVDIDVKVGPKIITVWVPMKTYEAQVITGKTSRSRTYLCVVEFENVGNMKLVMVE
jgi:hypothetical protein